MKSIFFACLVAAVYSEAEPTADADADAWYGAYGYRSAYSYAPYSAGYAGLTGYAGYGYGYPTAYAGYGYGHAIGKRSADAEPEAEADAWYGAYGYGYAASPYTYG